MQSTHKTPSIKLQNASNKKPKALVLFLSALITFSNSVPIVHANNIAPNIETISQPPAQKPAHITKGERKVNLFQAQLALPKNPTDLQLEKDRKSVV